MPQAYEIQIIKHSCLWFYRHIDSVAPIDDFIPARSWTTICTWILVTYGSCLSQCWYLYSLFSFRKLWWLPSMPPTNMPTHLSLTVSSTRRTRVWTWRVCVQQSMTWPSSQRRWSVTTDNTRWASLSRRSVPSACCWWMPRRWRVCSSHLLWDVWMWVDINGIWCVVHH